MGRHTGGEEAPEFVHSEWDSPSEPYKLAATGLAGVACIVVSFIFLTGISRLGLLILGCLLTLPATLITAISTVVYAVNRRRTRRGSGTLYLLGTTASLAVGGLVGLDALTAGTAAFAPPVVLACVAIRLAAKSPGNATWRWRKSGAVALIAVGSAATSAALLFG